MRTFKPLISMISGFSNVSMSPKTIYFYLRRPQDTSNNSRKFPNHLKYIMNLGNVRICTFENVGNVCPTESEVPEFKLFNL